MIPRTLAVSALAALLCGCAGYNHTLFMTKSNAGLDFDAKPPTAEITISRKEAVIAPAFEGGQTPPVMASFKPDIGANGPFVNFFLGVDQTFAGGDAARAMTELYDRRDVPPGRDPSAYDSALKLTAEPKGPIRQLDIPKPGKVRPFIFGTDTMLGLKVAWSGAGGQMPDTVKAGFNRKEFAWAPLTMTRVANDTNAPWRVKMPSFLATIDSQIEAGTNKTGITALQYFATGEAATRLALQPDVRAAMLARLDPNRENFQTRFGAKLAPQERRIARSVLRLVYEGLREQNRNGRTNASAAALVTRLDALASSAVPAQYPFTHYTLVGTNLETQARKGEPVPGTAAFPKLLSYWDALSATIGHLERSREISGLTLDGQPVSAATILSQLAETTALANGLEQVVANTPAVLEAVDYFVTLIKD